jgi:RNA polymerase sigma factor (sigma-70 family)
VNAQSDIQLLCSYVERRSEAAFAELVNRHIDFVHSAAFRMVNDPHLAKDVTQGVFIALAKDAGKLTNHPVLSGWLHITTRNIAANAIRSEVRRRTREKEAAVMNEERETEASWEEIAPHLDAALAELTEPDRDAVLLRYFENKPAQEMAAILGISAEAAQKRVNRAVEKLRGNFAKRGVTAGMAGLAGVISVNAVQAAPAGLAAASLAAVFTGQAGVLLATKTLAMTAIQKAIAFTAVVALITGATIYHHQRSSSESVSILTSPIATERATKSQRRVQTPTTSAVSERNRERIRATLRSAAKSADPFQRDDTAVLELEDLLRSRPGDLAFVHELAMEVRSTSQDTQLALATALVRRYRDGDFQRLGELIDALGTEGVSVGIQAHWFSIELIRCEDEDLRVRAFEELLARPSKVIRPDHYQNIATGAAKTIGYAEALERISDSHDGWFGTAAASDLISNWSSGDPVAASIYVRDLPASPLRDSLIIHLVEAVARSEDFEMAIEWANSLQGDAKEKALALVKQRQDILRSREEQRARLPDQEED